MAPGWSVHAQTAAQATQGREALVANQGIAKTQALGATLNIMKKGAQSCDEKGENCRDGLELNRKDQMNYTALSKNAGQATGVLSQSFANKDGGGSITSQTAPIMISCMPDQMGTTQVIAGIAIKTETCSFDEVGNATLDYRVCTAPVRGFKVKPADNEVACSTNRNDPSYRPPAGKICTKPTCDTSPLSSLNGWSAVQTATYLVEKAAIGTEKEKQENGLKLTLFPDLSSGVPASFTSNSESMTALRIAGIAPDKKTKERKIAAKIAFRSMLTLDAGQINAKAPFLVEGGNEPPFVATIRKMQDDPMTPVLQKKVGQTMIPCMDKLYDGVKTGSVEVCNPNFTDEANGFKPAAKTAAVAALDKPCETKTECIQELVKTSTMTKDCLAAVPLANKNCTTTTDYTLNSLEYSRTRPTEECRETRFFAQYRCTTEAVATGAKAKECPAGTRIVNVSELSAPQYNDPYNLLRVTCLGNNDLHIQWASSIGGVTFDNASIYGSTYMNVDLTIKLNPFESQIDVPVGLVCVPSDANGVPNLFNIRCAGENCSYSIRAQTGGNCGWSTLQPSVDGSAAIGFEATYAVINNCSTYEAAK